MMKIDYTEYVVILVNGDISISKDINYKAVKINKRNLLFVPYPELRNVLENLHTKYRIITLSWSIMYPVIIKLLDEDWDFKFQNDEDVEELENINEKFNTPMERLNKVKEYFESKYTWPNGIPDPILHTRLIMAPPESTTDFIFYYGETVNLQNNSQEDIEHLFKFIIDEYEKVEYNSFEKGKSTGETI